MRSQLATRLVTRLDGQCRDNEHEVADRMVREVGDARVVEQRRQDPQTRALAEVRVLLHRAHPHRLQRISYLIEHANVLFFVLVFSRRK